MKIDILFLDLDKTLLDNEHRLSQINRKALEAMGKKGIIRVIATGRSLFSFEKLCDKDLDVDYLIFSTGAGIINFKTKKTLMEKHLSEIKTKKAAELLISARVNFMIHEPIPDNHNFIYWKCNVNVPDFERRLELYKGQARELKYHNKIGKSSQLVAIFNHDEMEKFAAIQAALSDFKVIRTTSPLDHCSYWMEIFPLGVSKGHAAVWLTSYLGLSKDFTASIGNDYNDLDLLLWTKFSFVVENAPKELKQQFTVVAANDEGGFSQLLEHIK